VLVKPLRDDRFQSCRSRFVGGLDEHVGFVARGVEDLAELTGGVAQVQGTVHRATLEVGERIADRAGDGSEVPGEFTYLLRPRSFRVIGRLDELVGEAGGVHNDRVRSFELFRRHLHEPEIVTFDELLARAEWVVENSEELP